MTELVRYEAAKRALAEAVAVDEVKQILDQAEALRHAKRIAGDRDLEIQAAQLRFRAERRLGELIKAAKDAGQVAEGRPKNCTDQEQFSRVTLKEAGIDRKLSARAQKVAELPAEKFEDLLEKHAGEMRSGAGRVAMDLLKVNAEAEGASARRELAVALSNASASLPTGRKYPVIYADPPWHRNQGVTSRSYENHYPTMSWSEICALPVKDLALPDAWLFLWIPRAHAFAWHEAEIEATVVSTGEVVTVKAPMPLASAVALSWGFGDYSTAFVWTKTDEDHPDEGGGAILVRDQDELLLMFKRGQGLPKPEKKFGSNHRERSRPLGHSTKPQFYRQMIAEMAGAGVPCLELFARFDPERPAPAGWDLWGNQASATPQGVVADNLDAVDRFCGQLVGGELEAPATEISDDGGFVVPDESRAAVLDLLQSDEPVAVASIEIPTSAPLEISEYEALKAIGDFCHPRRAEICAAVGADYVAKGFAVIQGGTNAWILREAGRARLNELEAERRASAPPAPAPAKVERDPLEIPAFLLRKRPQLELGLVVPPKVDVIDDHVQTRLPVNDVEISEAIAMRAIEAGEEIDSEIARHLIGKFWLHCPTQGKMRLTEEGRAALASFVDIPMPAPATEARA